MICCHLARSLVPLWVLEAVSELPQGSQPPSDRQVLPLHRCVPRVKGIHLRLVLRGSCQGDFHIAALLSGSLGLGCQPWGFRSLARASGFQRTLLMREGAQGWPGDWGLLGRGERVSQQADQTYCSPPDTKLRSCPASNGPSGQPGLAGLDSRCPQADQAHRLRRGSPVCFLSCSTWGVWSACSPGTHVSRCPAGPSGLEQLEEGLWASSPAWSWSLFGARPASVAWTPTLLAGPGSAGISWSQGCWASPGGRGNGPSPVEGLPAALASGALPVHTPKLECVVRSNQHSQGVRSKGAPRDCGRSWASDTRA